MNALFAQYRLYLQIAAALILIAAFAWFIHHERELGAERESAAVNKAVLAAQEALRRDFDAKARLSSTIGDTYHAAVSVPVLAPPVVHWLRVPAVCADRVPEAAATPGGTHAEAASRAADSIDIGAPLTTVGRDADAQVAALQDYIIQVCLK